jgi:NitT/TauT family transport system ATP-binding protein
VPRVGPKVPLFAIADLRGVGVSAIEFRNVALSLGGDRIYDNISFQVAKSEFVCILGPSGCGKSTSLRLIGDLIKPDQGQVIINGKAPSETWSDIAFVFQSPRLAPWRNVIGNVLLGVELRYGKAEAKRRRELGAKLLDMVGLSGFGAKYPLMLSGGERQRVAIGRALMLKPRLLLLDEPLASLDPARKSEIMPYLLRLRDEAGIPMVYVSHYARELKRIANVVVRLDGGRVIATGGPDILSKADEAAFT